jgi:hypothetical protein
MYADAGTEQHGPVTVDERYETASNTSDLTLQLDPDLPGGAADVLIAAAWSEVRVGGALLRLHSQWESTEKIPRAHARPAKFYRGIGLSHADADAAHLAEYAEVTAWNMRNMTRLIGRLAALPAVREQITIRAAMWGMEAPHAKAAEIIRYWLDQNCHACDGRKFRMIPGTPALSNKVCGQCQGSGVGHVPHGQEGRRLANYMDACVHRARQGIRNHLRNSRKGG